jgi:hypothetical protein
LKVPNALIHVPLVCRADQTYESLILEVRSSNLFGRANYTIGGAEIIFMIGFCPYVAVVS